MRSEITTCSRFACYVLVPSPASTSPSVVSCIVIAAAASTAAAAVDAVVVVVR